MLSSRDIDAFLPPVSDPDLVMRAVAGDLLAFPEIYLRYVKRITSLVARMLKHGSECDEVTQEVFLQVHLSLRRFEGRSSFYTWIFRLATNVTLHHLRASKRRYKVTHLTEIAEARLVRPDWLASSNTERDADYNALLAETTRVIDALIPTQRAIMVLGPIEGHSTEQMADILGVSSEVVKSRLHRARTCAKEAMWRAERRGVPLLVTPDLKVTSDLKVAPSLVIAPQGLRMPMAGRPLARMPLAGLPLEIVTPTLIVSR